VSANHRFYLITLTAVLAILVTLSLGRWQLSRAAEKEALQAAMGSQLAKSSLSGASLLALKNPLAALHQGVTVRGVWVAEKTVFLDNRQMNAKPGFYVLTPLRLEGTSSHAMIQRGWVARNFLNRETVPVINTPQGLVTVSGRIALPPAKLYELGKAGSGLIRQNLDLVQFGTESGLSLLPVSIVQTDPASEGLLREWPVVGSSADKNYGYAFQWFGLSALISILYVWFQIGKRFNFPRWR
jgi:surfeit locus 1 family protein